MDIGLKTNSLSLVANARDKKMDVIVSIGVLISIIANYQNIPYVEGVVSTLIALFILKEGILSTKESVFYLLDYWNDPGLVKKIKKILKEEKKLVLDVKNLRLRRAGTFVFGEVFIELNPFAGVQDYRDEIDLLQEKIKALNPYIKDFSIFSHIPQFKAMKVAVPIQSGRSLKAKVASALADTNAYLFANIKNHKIKNFYVKKIKKSQKRNTEFAKFLSAEKANIVIDNDINSLTYYSLRHNYQIMVYPNFSDVGTAEKTLKLLLIDT